MDLDLVGYNRCRCGRYYPENSAECAECRSGRGKVAVAVVDVLVAGQVVSVGPKRKTSRRRGSYVPSERVRAYKRARNLAISRMVAIYPEMWEAIFAEELAAQGQAPVRTHMKAKRRAPSIRT